jgi:hypothetical protein
MKQNPFSLYDFLGYFVPGAAFLYGTLASCSAVRADVSFPTLASTLFAIEKAELYLPLILISYIVGHLLSFISSLTVERFSIWKLGYPSKYLLGLPFPKYLDVAAPKRTRVAVRVLVALFLLPVALTDLVAGNLLKLRELYAKPLDPFLVEFLRDKIQQFLNLRAAPRKGKGTKKVNAAEVDLFRLVYHYAVEHAPAHLPKMQNYVALYGFLRTITLSFVVFFWVAIGISLSVPGAALGASLSAAALFALAFLAYLDFLKFYRRFSLEVLMALTAIVPMPGPA